MESTLPSQALTPYSRANPPSSGIYPYFTLLHEKCRERFLRLSQLPAHTTAVSSDWHDTFKAYSTLWTLQQTHRAALIEAGLTRWTLGAVASAIGQLYYSYYQHTGNAAYLHDAYTFYNAIRSRQYFMLDVDDSELVLQQLRYYSRFVLVCVLLHRTGQVAELMEDMHILVGKLLQCSHGSVHEWQIMLADLILALDATRISQLPCSPTDLFLGSSRLPLLRRQKFTEVLVTDALLVTYYHRQPRVSTVPLEAIRMSQSLEWSVAVAAPAQGSDAKSDDAANASLLRSSELDAPSASSAAHIRKSLHVRCSASGLLACLTGVAHAMQPGKWLLLYIAADTVSPDVDLSDAAVDEARASRECREGVLLAPPPPPRRRACVPQQQSSGELSSSRPSSSSVPIAARGNNGSAGASQPRGHERHAAAGLGDPELATSLEIPSRPPAPPPELHKPEGSDELRSAFSGLSVAQADGPARRAHPKDYVPHAVSMEQALLPSDLVPVTRARMLLVVDSDNSAAFRSVCEGAHVPVLALMSPVRVTSEVLRSQEQVGKLFTLFLTTPVLALVRLLLLPETAAVVERLQDVLQGLAAAYCQACQDLAGMLPKAARRQSVSQHGSEHSLPEKPDDTSPSVTWTHAAQDPFVNRLLCRFALFNAVLIALVELDEWPSGPGHLPFAEPSLPSCLDHSSAHVQQARGDIFELRSSIHSGA